MNSILCEIEEILGDMLDPNPTVRSEIPKRRFLEELRDKLSKHKATIHTGTFGDTKHAWIYLESVGYIVDPYASNYHHRLVASNERIMAYGKNALDFGLCVAKLEDMNEYRPDADIPTATDYEKKTKIPHIPPSHSSPLPAPPKPKSQKNVWILGANGVAIQKTEDVNQMGFNDIWKDLRGTEWRSKYAITNGMRNEFLSCVCPFLADKTGTSTISLTRFASCSDDDPEYFLVPLYMHILKSNGQSSGMGLCDRFLCALNWILRMDELGAETPKRVGFTVCEGGPFPFAKDAIYADDFGTGELADRCIPSIRDLAVHACERYKCRLEYKAPYLFVAKKFNSKLECVEYTSMADVDEIAKTIEIYLCDEKSERHGDPEIHIRIPTNVLTDNVIKNKRTVYVSERHLKSESMRMKDIFKTHIHYGQATVGDFCAEDESCLLVVYKDLRFFVASQRTRAVRKLQQIVKDGVCPERISNREGAPSIQLSKGMFRKSDHENVTPLVPISAHDASWRTYHPSTYSVGDMSKDFDERICSELEPLVLHDRLALICTATLTELLIRPTIEYLIRDIQFVAIYQNMRLVHCTPYLWKGSVYIPLDTSISPSEQESVRVYGYGGRNHKILLDTEPMDGECEKIFIRNGSILKLYSRSTSHGDGVTDPFFDFVS